MITKPLIIHEAITLNPDPAKFLPIEVNSAFPKGAQSRLTSVEKARIDDLIEGVPDINDTRAINYWRDMNDKKVYLEGWIDKCLATTGLPPMEGGEWDEKIQYMIRVGYRTLIEKQEERNRPPTKEIGLGLFTLIEGGFREFEAGDRGWLYGVTWGVYEKTKGSNPLTKERDKPIARPVLVDDKKSALPSEAFNPPREGDNQMTERDLDQLAEAVANKIKEETSTFILILHSIPEACGRGGIVVNPDVAARTPCACYGNVCFSPGIVGALSESERKAYCPSVVEKTSPAMTKRLEKWNEAKEICKTKAAEYEKGERLIPYIQCMGMELGKRGISL